VALSVPTAARRLARLGSSPAASRAAIARSTMPGQFSGLENVLPRHAEFVGRRRRNAVGVGNSFSALAGLAHEPRRLRRVIFGGEPHFCARLDQQRIGLQPPRLADQPFRRVEAHRERRRRLGLVIGPRRQHPRRRHVALIEQHTRPLDRLGET
jgi:hypothetical protein